MATPKMAKGSSTKRSETYNQLILPTVRKEAMTVLMSRFSCTIEEPKMAGNISLAIRLTPALAPVSRGIGRHFSFNKNGTCKASCAAPPMNTPQARAVMGCAILGAKKIAARIKATLSNTGVSAGMAKRCFTLSRLAAIAVSDIKNK